MRLRLGLLVLTGAAAFAAVGPALDAHAPARKDAARGLTELGEPRPPSRAYPLGTDALGRCELLRLAQGARASLAIGALATLLALGAGTLIGVAAALAGGILDAVVVGLCELLLAFPFALAAIAFGAAVRDRPAEAGNVGLVVTLAVFGWAGAARAIRAKTLTIRAQAFVLAAHSVGAGGPRLLVRHVLPHLRETALLLASRAAPAMILAEAGLSYLGLGPPPPAASWGRMLREGQFQLAGAPWLAIAPGLAILVTAAACNLVADQLASERS